LRDTDILVLALPLDEQHGCIGALNSPPCPRTPCSSALPAMESSIDPHCSTRCAAAASAARDSMRSTRFRRPMIRCGRHPTCWITPKVSAYHPDMQQKFEAFAESQTRRFLSGGPLEAVVDMVNIR
jgi:hypothetical protein